MHLRDDLVCLGDGYSELVLVRNPGSLAEFKNIVGQRSVSEVRQRGPAHPPHPRAKFSFEKPVAWTRDGEAGGEYQEIELKNYQCPLQFIF